MSTSLISKNRLSRSENLVPVLTWKSNNRQQNIVEKRSNFSSFPQYFQYISIFRSQITYSFVKCGCLIYFSLILQIWYFKVQISQSISERSPLDFEITGVDYIYIYD